MTLQSHIEGKHLAEVIERLKYAASKAGSIGLGEYTRVHKKDLSTLIEAFESSAKPERASDLVEPLARSLKDIL